MTAVLLVVGGLVALMFLAAAYFLLRVEEWEGDVPAVVASPGPGTMTVELSGYLPADAVRRDPGTRRFVTEPLLGATVGEPVICRVRQTFQAWTNLATGPQTKVQRCWR